MRKVCLLNRRSVRSEITRDKHNHYISTKEESIYAIKTGKDSQLLKRLCSMKLKSVNFRIVVKRNLTFRYDDRFFDYFAKIEELGASFGTL